MNDRDGRKRVLIGIFAGALSWLAVPQSFADTRHDPAWLPVAEAYGEAARADAEAADEGVLVPPGYEADEPLSDTPSEDGTRRGMEIRPEGEGTDEAPSGCLMRDGPLELLV